MAQAAEQDNRVQIPNGTAAVCADGVIERRKPVTGEFPGKADHHRGKAVLRKARVRRPTHWILPHPAWIRGVAFVAEKRLRRLTSGRRSLFDFSGGNTYEE